MTPLDRLSAGRIPFGEQWHARLAICRHVLGVGPDDILGPVWRRGSNNRPRPAIIDMLTESLEPCRHCGAPSENQGSVSVGNGAYIFCPYCGTEEPAGDYDWSSLADCKRYIADLFAGEIEIDVPALCDRCGRDAYEYSDQIASGGSRCDQTNCALAPVDHDAVAIERRYAEHKLSALYLEARRLNPAQLAERVAAEARTWSAPGAIAWLIAKGEIAHLHRHDLDWARELTQARAGALRAAHPDFDETLIEAEKARLLRDRRSYRSDACS